MVATATHTLTDVLAAGLRWLYDTEQPAGAITQPHSIPVGHVDNRLYRFSPQGARSRPVIVVDIIDHDFDHDRMEPRNILHPGELADLVETLTATFGVEVDSTWNGHGVTGSIGLRRPAHPSLLAAVDLYSAGCPNHRSVLCGCSWSAPGHALLIQPRALLPAH